MPLDTGVISRYPIHYAVYINDVTLLRQTLDETRDLNIDELDCRGRCPLMLAVTLGHKECAYELLKRGANADLQDRGMWSISHEAISLGDPNLITEVIKYRDFQRNLKATRSTARFLKSLADTADFYCEMSWEFSSWIPFVKRMCPSDTYRIYKQGSNVRIDTTLVGFDSSSWQRGNQSFVFSLDNENRAQIVIMDHETNSATKQTLHEDNEVDNFTPTSAEIEFRRTTPTSTTYIDVDKIGFERSRSSGVSKILSWMSSADKVEKVDGYDCKVFDASNVNLVTKTRSEHLSQADKDRIKEEQASSSINNLLNYIRSENEVEMETQNVHETGLPASEYLDPDFPLEKDIGRPKEVTVKSNTFKAVLWLAESYPLNLQEQVLPIVELMSSSSAHFARLQNFMRMQLPAGFPVKIEIPLFHVVSAKITFGKVNEPGPLVTPLETGTDFAVKSVAIDDNVFHVPSSYRVIDETSPHLWWPDETESQPQRSAQRLSSQQQDEILLQLAIQQSLRESRGEPPLPPMNDYGLPLNQILDDSGLPGYYDSEDAQMARAIEESLRLSGDVPAPVLNERDSRNDNLIDLDDHAAEQDQEDDLTRALRISAEEEARQKEELAREEEELRKVLELSLMEK